MRINLFALLLPGVVLSVLAQTPNPAPPPLLKDPRAIFDAAAPYYDFTDPALKPWHLKAAYQLYDENGNPSKKGVFEYWWESTKTQLANFDKYRISWSRQGAKYIGWYLENGEYAYESVGEPLNLFEYKLQPLLLAPLPVFFYGHLRDVQAVVADASVGTKSGLCINLVPNPFHEAAPKLPPKVALPIYCFDENGRALLSSYSPYDHLLTRFDGIVQTQGKYFSSQISIFDGEHKLLTAKVQSIDTIGASDPAFVPDTAATRTRVGVAGEGYPQMFNLSREFAATRLLRKVAPIYPAEAELKQIQGTVVLGITIGTDGRTHYIRVLSSPDANLADAAFRAVSQWEYKPYVVGGRKEPVDTVVNFVFKLPEL
ncbi:MAG TPA: energy transducer TonB [Terracidiphilus sp.]|nr:energy transducer TonB [Terracidiphilus sp.]